MHAFGFSTTRDAAPIYGLAAETPASPVELNPAVNKKFYSFYRVAEEEWQEVHESVFSGQRKMSLDTLDENF